MWNGSRVHTGAHVWRDIGYIPQNYQAVSTRKRAQNPGHKAWVKALHKEVPPFQASRDLSLTSIGDVRAQGTSYGAHCSTRSDTLETQPYARE